MHVLATGPRDCRPSDVINAVVTHLQWVVGPHLVVIQGGASGADSHVKEACAALGVACHTEPADWNGPCDIDGGWCRPGHRRRRGNGSDYCPAAGPRRNQLMLDVWQPELTIAILDRALSATRGTKDMIERVDRAGCEYVEVDVRLGFSPAIEAVGGALARLS